MFHTENCTVTSSSLHFSLTFLTACIGVTVSAGARAKGSLFSCVFRLRNSPEIFLPRCCSSQPLLIKQGTSGVDWQLVADCAWATKGGGRSRLPALPLRASCPWGPGYSARKERKTQHWHRWTPPAVHEGSWETSVCLVISAYRSSHRQAETAKQQMHFSSSPLNTFLNGRQHLNNTGLVTQVFLHPGMQERLAMEIHGLTSWIFMFR